MPCLSWSYGITSHLSRVKNGLLDATLKSLASAGFTAPRLFIDGASCTDLPPSLRDQATCHNPLLRVFGNWVMSLWELWVRNPDADRYAIFQDDLIAYRGLKEYLEASLLPDKAYLNLYTFPRNMEACPTDRTAQSNPLVGFFRARNLNSGPANYQYGWGALALVFPREAVRLLLASPHMVDRPMDVRIGWKNVDGGIVTTMNKAGWSEYVHHPSLVQHTGDISTIQPMGQNKHPKAATFLGEGYNAMELLCRVGKSLNP